jgi:hypothetical protein
MVELLPSKCKTLSSISSIANKPKKRTTTKKNPEASTEFPGHKDCSVLPLRILLSHYSLDLSCSSLKGNGNVGTSPSFGF